MSVKKILISGATGLVGTALVKRLKSKGHAIVRLTRPSPSATIDDITWNPDNNWIDAERLNGFDAVIHLAGESIADGRWTAAKKERIRNSRVQGTTLLAEALARLTKPPRTLIAASAIGFYGERGQESMVESNEPGHSFLADVCKAWEMSTEPAAKKGIRVVNLRLGVILAKEGGALKTMMPPFKMGVGGKLGSGKQYMSWVALDDVLGIIELALENETIHGPVNTVAPNAVTNLEFTKALGRALSRPTIFPMPAFAAKLAFGEMADELLLASTRVEPAVLNKAGYQFKYPELDGALRTLLI